MKTIVLTGGGTMGHVTPNLALIPKLTEEGWEISYIGSKTGMEKDELQKDGTIPYYGISSGKLRRYISIDNLKDPFKVVAGLFEAYSLLNKLKPNVVFSKGGYVTVPVVLAARFLHIPVIIHESDITPGLANKIASKGANKICVNFPETLKYVGEKGVLTGTPLRQEIFTGSKSQGMKLCKFSTQKPVLLIMGGSSGSATVNDAVRAAVLDLVKQFNVVHICGNGKIDSSLENVNGYKQFEFVSQDLKHLFAMADIVVSRAGANTLAEIVALGLPNILIPLEKGSRGDQVLNAQSMQKQGFSEIMSEDNLGKDLLIETITRVYQNRDYYCNAMANGGRGDGTGNVLKEIRKYNKA
ncbi:MAG: UDP-N-acetylglucosamine--N-acetylmuramyl-(pentapeptide) pyrophosphoryl-undecaprenol N-acetylglucosamine transferase [Epulopiscium sp. Nele67-Bin002]|nr:MAG: undecaprenyldiphospho-muramoylpentapeptide beta-N-acetylglucosaminyltransferase [Epulopiscium sp. Nuni2H_MBin001]OON92659.1 MAG: UDP-N-acetylglucosamine--N-acetylmuramyl-(pentapeptide) pyrophosphoryl-undecaprenol N-acetylglucosamine transferase [Epulopiscium sp. Nele67-Bin002]OON93805.1 MAG: undecaprenyldiphospho-muramoylpentapeptide beta-N-acetylglucosaminyltransferase [Epulopiscium sp. Nele67-Bin001]